MRYFIVVHGIGKQRKNETVLDVINRFAEARRGLGEQDISNILTLGKATGQTGKEKSSGICRHNPPENQFVPWLEFEGIPQNPIPPPNKPFLGQPSNTGENLRFVDLCWSDVMEEDFKDVGQEVDVWAEGLLGRLERKHADALTNNKKGAEVPFWVRKVLRLLVETLVFLRQAMNFRVKKMSDLVFTQFLGDIQLYGEYAQTRGQAARRFHKLMARIEKKHYEMHPDIKPKYTIIAHSLGTVMSMDALLYAHVDPAIRSGEKSSNVPNLPFDGFWKDEEKAIFEKKNDGVPLSKEEEEKFKDLKEFLDSKWIRNVDFFVTLGSPIDKYLVMWWQNYKYLLEPAKWRVHTRGKKIKHLNYCDEQDPVGHELDVARTAPGFIEIFDSTEENDRVFIRYSKPGAAHNEYWKDLDLFKWILYKTVDEEEKRKRPEKPVWFKERIFRKVLRISYKWIPYSVVVVDFLTFTWALNAKKFHALVIATLIFLGVSYLGRKLLDMVIWWRQVLRIKGENKWIKREWGEEKKKQSEKFERFLKIMQWGYLIPSWILVPVYILHWGNWELAKQMSLILLISVSTLLLWRRLSHGNNLFGSADWSVIRLTFAPYLLLIGLAYSITSGAAECFFNGMEFPGMKTLNLTSKTLGKFMLYVTSFVAVAAVVFTYLNKIFQEISTRMDKEGVPKIDFKEYASHP